ncbi:hypothetical protein AYI69_g9347 [Smittium culicis]|uniref:Uncharacterized protein n=1 Tax=Smittium culicis TaxID=133412 RepID=A0A1R1XDB6_9FUNG|nr:hypothetical protein AYI69_g9347 [Smittium culicis]
MSKLIARSFLNSNLGKASIPGGRVYSTTKSEGDEVQSFVPGKKGYSPQFPPPRNWPAAPKPKKNIKTPDEVPPPSPVQSKSADPNKPAFSYKLEMKKLRYQYYKDSLAKGVERKAMIEKNIELKNIERKKQIAEHLSKTKEYIEKVMSDPYSSYNVLNPQGQTVLSMPSEDGAENKTASVSESNTGEAPTENLLSSSEMPSKKTIKEVNQNLSGSTGKIRPPRVSVSYPIEENKKVAAIRKQRRDAIEAEKKQKRLEDLVNLYHNSSSYITLDNLDYKISEFFSSASGTHYMTLEELVESRHDNGGLITASESLKRTVQLQNALNSTFGHDEKIGLERIIEWSNKKNKLDA